MGNSKRLLLLDSIIGAALLSPKPSPEMVQLLETAQIEQAIERGKIILRHTRESLMQQFDDAIAALIAA